MQQSHRVVVGFRQANDSNGTPFRFAQDRVDLRKRVEQDGAVRCMDVCQQPLYLERRLFVQPSYGAISRRRQRKQLLPRVPLGCRLAN